MSILKIGSAVQYVLGKGLLTLKAQFGVSAANRPEGTFLWLENFGIRYKVIGSALGREKVHDAKDK